MLQIVYIHSWLKRVARHWNHDAAYRATTMANFKDTHFLKIVQRFSFVVGSLLTNDQKKSLFITMWKSPTNAVLQIFDLRSNLFRSIYTCLNKFKCNRKQQHISRKYNYPFLEWMHLWLIYKTRKQNDFSPYTAEEYT